VQATLEADKAWWQGRQSDIQSAFMKELDAEGQAKTEAAPIKKAGSDDDAVLVDADGPSGSQGNKKKGKK
jgi:translocation protein SEC66